MSNRKVAPKGTNQDQKQKDSLISHLNEDLAGELGAITQYIT